MTTVRQIAANGRNARMSTGPTTEEGKQRSRRNALRHGLTAETIVEPLEDPEEYQIFEASILVDYAPQTTIERELVCRLASLMWRIRRATAIETGLLQIQATMVKTRRDERELGSAFDRLSPSFVNSLFRARSRKPNNNNANKEERAGAPDIGEDGPAGGHGEARPASVEDPAAAARDLTWSFLRLAHLDNGAFDRLSRYEAVIWRQIAQTLFLLGTMRRR
jgi:hypothetical protein